MSITSYNFKDHITIDNNKYIKWLDPTGTIRNNVIVLDNTSHFFINSVSNGNVYINSNVNTSSRTIFNTNTSQPVIIGSKLGIGLNENDLVNSTLTLVNNSVIGLVSTFGTLTLCSSNTTEGSARIQLYGNGVDTSILQGNLNLYAGNVNDINAGIGFYTENNSKKMKIFKDGTIEITPDGTNVKFKVQTDKTTFNHDVYITTTTVSTNSTTGSIVIDGGVSLKKGVYIYDSTQSIGYGSGGALTISGGASIGKDLYVGGTISSRSDIRLKENIQLLQNENVTDFINNVRTIRFNYIDEEYTPHLGFVAQDFIKYPELIRQNEIDGYYNLDYSKVTVLLVECIKELKKEIDTLKNKLY